MHNKSFFTVLVCIFLIVSLSLGNVSIAFADGSSPGETPTAAPTEDPGDPSVIETPAAESTPEPEVEELQPGGESASVDESAEGAETTSDDGLLAQLPENTEVVVLDENGETVPLATQDALDIILDTDPMWCPAGTLPGGTSPDGFSCSTNFATFGLLLKDMQKYTDLYATDGIIYFTATAIDSLILTESALGATDFGTLKGFDLTLQGGWDGENGADADFSGQTSFGRNTLTIGTEDKPWVGNITLNNFVFSGVRSTTNNAITIYTTTGNITLDNVDVSQQTGGTYAANLDSQSGNITVENGSSFDGNNSGTNQSQGFRAETGGAITITGSSSAPITFTDSRGVSSNYNGATLSAPTVTLNYVTATNNDLNGIQISNANLVTLNNVIAGGNGTDTASPDADDLGSGVLVNGTGSTLVNLTGGAFTNNERYGVEVTNGSINVLASPTCSGNDLGCLIDPNPPTLTLPGDMLVEATSAAGATVTYSASATDNLDGNVSISCSEASGSVFPLGTTTVLCSATDSHNHTANGSFDVSVVDTTPPALTLPGNITMEATSAAGATVTYSASATDIVDGSLAVSCSPASGSVFPLGTTTVNCSATDSHGQTGAGSFTVSVVDTTPPTLTLPGNITMEATSAAGATVTYSASATDIVDGSPAVNCSPASGSVFALGTTTVNCSATDSHGQTGAGSFTVTVRDTTAPTIQPHANVSAKTHFPYGMIVSYVTPATTDIVDGTGVATCNPPSGSFFKEGNTLITCTATDSHGNSATPVTFVVFVRIVEGTVATQSNPGNFVIPVTAGEPIDLDCSTTVNAFGIIVKFSNLCGYQAIITKVDSNTLPGQLDGGMRFANGINIAVLLDGELVEPLPAGAQLEVNFPIPQGTGNFTALRWDNAGHAWIEFSPVQSAAATNNFYQILTTEHAGTFVLVSK